jgi:hypothetical protein
MGQAVAAACSQRGNAIHFLMAHGHDRSVSSGRAATGGGAASALGAAGGGVADLSGKGRQKPLRLLRPALRTGDGCLIFPAPEENLKGFSTFSALEFINRHRFISSGGPQHPPLITIAEDDRSLNFICCRKIRRNPRKCQGRSRVRSRITRNGNDRAIVLRPTGRRRSPHISLDSGKRS